MNSELILTYIERIYLFYLMGNVTSYDTKYEQLSEIIISSHLHLQIETITFVFEYMMCFIIEK